MAEVDGSFTTMRTRVGTVTLSGSFSHGSLGSGRFMPNPG